MCRAARGRGPPWGAVDGVVCLWSPTPSRARQEHRSIRSSRVLRPRMRTDRSSPNLGRLWEAAADSCARDPCLRPAACRGYRPRRGGGLRARGSRPLARRKAPRPQRAALLPRPLQGPAMNKAVAIAWFAVFVGKIAGPAERVSQAECRGFELHRPLQLSVWAWVLRCGWRFGYRKSRAHLRRLRCSGNCCRREARLQLAMEAPPRRARYTL